MGNRAHEALLTKYPWLRWRDRGTHGNGPDREQKRIWAKRLRQRIRQLLRRDPDDTAYPRRAGDRWEWY